MQYHQKQYPFYNPELIRMSMGSSDFTVNYVELLDESCVEFRHVHDDSYEIYYCLEGTQNFWAGNERLTLTGGMFLLLAPGSTTIRSTNRRFPSAMRFSSSVPPPPLPPAGSAGAPKLRTIL